MAKHTRINAVGHWRKRMIQRARWRLTTHNAKAQEPPVSMARNVVPQTTKQAFIDALIGSCGNKKVIAEKLHVSRQTVCNLLNRPDWADVRDLYAQELELSLDDAEETIRHLINQRGDLRVAGENARWLLSRLKKETYGLADRRFPVNVNVNNQNNTQVNTALVGAIPVESLTLPIEVKRQLLEAVDAQRKAEMDKAATRAFENAKAATAEEDELVAEAQSDSDKGE